MGIADTVEEMFGGTLPFRLEAYDASAAGPEDSKLTIRVKNPEAIVRVFLVPVSSGLLGPTSRVTSSSKVTSTQSSTSTSLRSERCFARCPLPSSSERWGWATSGSPPLPRSRLDLGAPQ